jgi:hypothetical protein
VADVQLLQLRLLTPGNQLSDLAAGRLGASAVEVLEHLEPLHHQPFA